MKTILEITPCNQNRYKFRLKFENHGDKPEELPLDKLKSSAEMVGFHFEENGKRLEAVDFRIFSKKVYHNAIVQPEKIISIDFIGKVEKRGEKYFCLTFDNASYLIAPGKKYTVWFSLDGYVSNHVDRNFEFKLDELR